MLSCLSCVQLFAIPWTVDRQAPLSMRVPRHEYWRGLPFPSSGDLPNPGFEPGLLCLLHWQGPSLPLSHLESLRIEDLFLISCVTLSNSLTSSGYNSLPWEKVFN